MILDSPRERTLFAPSVVRWWGIPMWIALLVVAEVGIRFLLDGITLSGGDPFCQQEECIALLDLLPNVNVWIYTGFEYEDICDTELAKRADVLVVGKFVEELKCEGEMYGSSNQRIIRNRIKQPAEE